MKTTKLLALLTALVLALSCVGTVTFAATETTVYEYGYEDVTDIPAGETSYRYPNIDNSSWHLNNAGNYGEVYIVNDNYSLDGNYMIVGGAGHQQSTFFESRVLTNDFSIQFSFLNCGGVGKAGWSPFKLCIYPAASFSNTNLPDDISYSIFSHYYNGGKMYMKGLDDVTSSFMTAKLVWYDVKASFGNVASGKPTYTIQVKKSADANWTTIIADYPLPSSWDCSQGLKTGKMIYHAGYDSIGFDNLKISTVSSYDISVTQPENGSLAIDGGLTYAAPGSSVTVTATPDNGYVVNKILVNGVAQTVTNNQATFTVTSDAVVSATFTMPGVGTILQNRTYEAGVDYDCEIADGETFATKSANPNGGCWWNNGGHPYRAGSYGYTYLVKHDADSPKSGQYMQVKIQGGDTGMIFSTDAAKTYTDSFVYEFSFMNPTDDVKNAGCSGPSTFDVYLYPETAKSDGRSGEGKIATIAVEKNIKVVNDTEEVAYTHFTTTRNVWYDARFVIDQSTSVPTYDLYMKETADSVWTKVAADVSFPKSADYSRGLGTWASIGLTQPGATNGYYVLNVDDIRTTTIPEMYAVDLEETENGIVSVSGASGDALVLPGAKVTVNVTPDEGYEIDSITVNGTTQPTAASFELTVNEDTSVKVTFKEIQKIAPAIAQVTMVGTDSYQGNPAVFAYSKLNQFTEGSALNYGMYLWQGGKTEKESAPAVLPLYAHVDETTLAVATPGAAFAIRAFGDAIKAGNTYSMQPFVGDVTGDAVEKTLAE